MKKSVLNMILASALAVIFSVTTVNAYAIFGDFNEDGVVDIKDLNIITSYYNTNNSKFDFNNDSIVDIYDITKVSKEVTDRYDYNFKVSLGGDYSNLSNWSIVNEKDGMIYYRNESDGGKLYRSSLDGSGAVKISEDSVYSINIIGDYIYYINYSDNKNIYKIYKDGSRKTKLAEGDAHYIQVSGGFVYFLSRDGLKLKAAKTDGSGTTTLVEGGVENFSIRGEYLYYTSLKDKKLYRIKDDGSEATNVIEQSIYRFALDGDNIYYINASDGYKLYKMDVNSGTKVKVMDKALGSINISGNYIYFSDYSSGALYRCNKQGGELFRIGDAFLSTIEGYNYINVIKDKIFYYNLGDNIIYRVNTDGSKETPLGYYKLQLNNGEIKNFNSIKDAMTYLNSNNVGQGALYDPSQNLLWDSTSHWVYEGIQNKGRYNTLREATAIASKYTSGKVVGKDGKVLFDKENSWKAVLGVAQDDLYIRPNPSMSSNSTLEVPKGEVLEILGRQGEYVDRVVNGQTKTYHYGFYKIRYYDKSGNIHEGYVTKYVDIISDDLYDNMIGAVAEEYESNGDPAAISSGVGDYGGKSYGTYQFSSNLGSLAAFIQWTKNENVDIYQRLNNAHIKDGGQPKIYGENFDKEWKQIAKEYYNDFYNMQQKYIKINFYDDLMRRLKNSGIEYSHLTDYLAVRNMLLSTSVQHGAYGAFKLINKLGYFNEPSNFIVGVYDERSKVDIYFPSSPTWHEGLINRFIKEKRDILNVYNKEIIY
ncbi:DUF5050 domain-containing protein [Clostridium sp. MSJ-4]|uniref:DUF5050 domain-containing protein n=1 Tax=Clostridium simiarum TaxID=2841506 RepID=A0ABS6EYR8_9CLOT|nr:DUF5050 domain-containing protein [Clostridium simiarum]MBU5590512.1 DUF5050 domain-containing protein [Clostridium simiarum]